MDLKLEVIKLLSLQILVQTTNKICLLPRESICAAAEAGANAIKFQSIQLNRLYLNPDKITADFVKQLEFPEEWHRELKSFCDEETFFSFHHQLI